MKTAWPVRCRTWLLAAVVLFAITARHAAAQQVPDSAFRPPVPRPAYTGDKGPRLCLDEAHHNFHTLDNRFWSFGDLARRDGYRVAPLRAAFDPQSLATCDLLVISNAQWSDREWSEYPSPTPSAFTDAEIAAVRSWVDQGGRLLLIADHMPLAGSAGRLAAAFGAQFTDGFAYKGFPAGADPATQQAMMSQPTLFLSGDGTLAAHAITRGRDSTERVTQVRSFTGQPFRLDVLGARPVLVLPSDYISLEPRIAWQFESTTPVRPVGGWLQGATLRVGKGRVAFFGEAAMFSAQVAGPQRRPMGMNAPMAEQNARFVLNTLHWLTGILEP
jgi:hypothetical protein